MKRKTKAKVVLQKQLSAGIYDLRLQTDLASDAHAGQFVGVYTGDKSKLLPRPISICEIDDNRLRLVYRVTGDGTGTDIISSFTPGDEVELLGILGNGYDVDMIAHNYRHPVLMGGGIGIPPMLELAKELECAYSAYKKTEPGTKEGDLPNISAILGYRDNDLFLSEEFLDVANVYIATEDGSEGTRGNVLDVMRTDDLALEVTANLSPRSNYRAYDNARLYGCDVILACGPLPMLRAISEYARDNNIKAYVSLEERMACGVGACLGCITVTSQTDSHSHVPNARICTDGPVFEADVLNW